MKNVNPGKNAGCKFETSGLATMLNERRRTCSTRILKFSLILNVALL